MRDPALQRLSMEVPKFSLAQQPVRQSYSPSYKQQMTFNDYQIELSVLRNNLMELFNKYQKMIAESTLNQDIIIKYIEIDVDNLEKRYLAVLNKYAPLLPPTMQGNDKQQEEINQIKLSVGEYINKFRQQLSILYLSNQSNAEDARRN